MQLEGEKNKNAFFLVMGIILIIGGLFFLNNYLMSSRINNPNNLSTLLKNNDLKEQANKKVVPKKINVDFFNNNEKFKSLQEIDIKIKDINELKVGTNNPFQLNVPHMDKQEKILNILKRDNLIREEQIEEIKKEISKDSSKFDEFLNKIIDNEKIVKAKAEFYNLPYMDITEMDISEGVLNVISGEVAENYHIICFDKIGRTIKVGIVDPDNFKAVEAVNFLVNKKGMDVEYFMISPESFSAAFKQYKSLSKELTSALKTREEEEGDLVEVSAKESEEMEEITKTAPVAKIVSVIIRHAVEGGASDIHIEPLKKESRVRYRIDGILHISLVLPRSVHNSIVARIKVLANLKLDETRIPQDGRIRLVIDGKEIDYRISILPVGGAEKVVMRILNTSKGAPKLTDLGYEGQQYETIMNNIKKTEGILLITGPTGSGKSTTLFSILDMLNKEGINISTLEDPVEYTIKGVNQSQIFPNLGYTFATGLRSFLRQDPDIIMVGEIRDGETAELSMHAALTGHFVVSTLHTTSAAGAIPRLVDMEIETFLLASTLNTIIAQRLCRKICPFCKEKIKFPEKILEFRFY